MNINLFPTFRGKHSENLIIHLIDQICFYVQVAMFQSEIPSNLINHVYQRENLLFDTEMCHSVAWFWIIALLIW